MISFFLLKGHKLEDLLNLTYTEKVFFKVTMDLHLEAKE